MRDQLAALIERVGIRVYGRELRKLPALHTWVLEETKDLPADASIAERVYVALHGPEASTCAYGEHKVFNALNKGYRFCASGCRCRREEQARKVTKHQAEVSTEERARRQDRQAQTLLALHGVTNSAHVPGAAEKAKRTSRERYGVDHHMRSPEMRVRHEVVMMERHGVPTVGLIPGARTKIEATNLERYGATSTMHLAREAFKAAHDGKHPFMLPEFQAKARATMVANHGVEHALQNPEVLARRVAKYQKLHGVDHHMHRPEVRAKLVATSQERYGRNGPGQAHFSDQTYAILQDETAFRAMFETLSLREITIALGIGYDTGRKYCDRYGIDLPMSSYEDPIKALLEGHGLHVTKGDRKVIKPYEIDLLVESRKVGIEFCGLYWHSERNKPDGRRYHLDKLDRVNAAGYRLVTIFEDEWVNKRPIVESRLLHILGLGERGMPARKLRISMVDGAAAQVFLDCYHLQGGGAHGYANYGAFEGDTLVALMTFARPRIALGRKAGGADELLRFATDGRIRPGVASRLFAAYLREQKPASVMSYADRRWSDGGLYRSLGFEDEAVTPPGYWYVHPNKLRREHRFGHRKDRIKDLVENGTEKSEAEIMVELGYYRIWDCGHYRFTWSE